jgi:hypothetical protein
MAALDDKGITGFAPKADANGVVSVSPLGGLSVPPRLPLVKSFIESGDAHALFTPKLVGAGETIEVLSNDSDADSSLAAQADAAYEAAKKFAEKKNAKGKKKATA